jgi:lantibiotic biosynthesis protein
MNAEREISSIQVEKWQPLLDGVTAQRAWQAIREIARELEPQRLLEPGGEAWSLAGGAAGTALFFAYLSEATGDDAFATRAVDDLERALAGAAERSWRLGLWEGVLGVSWAYDHLEGRLFENEEAEDSVDDEADIDALLSSALAGETENYDLIQGLVGYGIACLEGLPRPGARRNLDAVLDRLLERTESFETGQSFFTPPSLLPEWQLELAPDGYYNLGVAHGVPAAIVLLARCVQEGIRGQELSPVLEKVVDWVMAYRGPEGFPSWVPKGKPPQRAARLAWCYGDPGIAAALGAAARAVDRPDWLEKAAEIATAAAARDLAMSGVKDSGICHGAAGLAHQFNRLWQASRRPELRDAARFWFGEVLKMQRDDGGIGGFKAWSPAQVGGELDWIDDPGLLTGSAGIGLCLLAAVTDLDPEWDRALALSTTSKNEEQQLPH